MSETVLLMPRRLAVEILHAAQIAQPDPIRGVVGARGGEPVSFHAGCDMPPPGEERWARLWSHPQTAAVPGAGELEAGGLSLVVSLNTKGVLEMRAWRLEGPAARELALAIHD